MQRRLDNTASNDLYPSARPCARVCARARVCVCACVPARRRISRREDGGKDARPAKGERGEAWGGGETGWRK